MIPLKKSEMQGAKFFRNETYLAYVAVAGKLKQCRRLSFFSGIKPALYLPTMIAHKFHKADTAHIFLMDFTAGLGNLYKYLRVFISNRNY
jgi:hypothetical protein